MATTVQLLIDNLEHYVLHSVLLWYCTLLPKCEIL